MPNIISISGTSRPGNYTSKALGIVNDELKRREVEPTIFDGRELSLGFPGHPPTADSQHLREAVAASSGVIIATPEYHGGYCAMTKLIIENLGFPSALSGKPVALLGVAAGRIGAIKSLEQLRSVCSHTGAIVLPGAVSIAGVKGAFDEDGNCLHSGVEDALRGLAGSLVEYMKSYVCPKFQLEAMIRQEDGESWTTTV